MTTKEIVKLGLFEGREIRKTVLNGEWGFSVADVVAVLTDSVDTRQYIKRMRQRDFELDSYWGTICTPLELIAPDDKRRKTNCANTEGLFRIIQSIPSPKAEPFKRWLAKVGHERIQEIENPELAQERMKSFGGGAGRFSGQQVHQARLCAARPARSSLSGRPERVSFKKTGRWEIIE